MLCTLSNYTYDAATKHYTATDPAIDMLSKDETSPIIDPGDLAPVIHLTRPKLGVLRRNVMSTNQSH